MTQIVRKAEDILDLAGMSDRLVSSLMEKLDGVSGIVWIHDQERSFRKVLSKGNVIPTPRQIDVADVLQRHGQVSSGSPFFERRNGKILLDSIFLPILHHDLLTGVVHLQLKSSSKEKALEEEILDSAREIVQEFTPFLNSALTLDRTRRTPLMDLDSESYNEPFILDFLARQVTISQRYHRRLGLISLDFQGVEAFQKNQSYRVVQIMLRDISETLKGIVRDYDVVSHVGNFRFLMALPDGDSIGCRFTIERMRKGFEKLDFLGERFSRYALEPHFGFACFPEDGTDVDSLLMAALEQTEQNRKDPFNLIQWKNRSFWDLVENFTGPGGKRELSRIRDTKFVEFHTGFTYLLQETVTNDIVLHPGRRGLLFVGTDNIYITEALLQRNIAIAKAATRISVFGDMSGVQTLRNLNINTIPLPPERASAFQFILYLSDVHAYGLVAVQQKEDTWKGVHSSHDKLVERLAFKLREEYSLQDQI